MTAIWRRDVTGWSRLAPTGFSAEAELHTLVEDAPQVLPLAGSPQLVVVGREVQLGTGCADLIAIEPSGRVAVIEIKLAANDEARRAVVSQILAYAAFLDRMTYEDFEGKVLARHLVSRGFASLAEAAETGAQGTFDAVRFHSNLTENLATGRFRLVLVLDRVPTDLTRLVAYLEGMASELVIDLVTVSAYPVGGETVLVPQRVEAERRPAQVGTAAGSSVEPPSSEGVADFEAATAGAPDETRQILTRIVAWARALETEGVARLVSARGQWAPVLRVYVPGASSLVVLYNDPTQGPRLSAFKSVFASRAPRAMAALEASIGRPLSQGGYISFDEGALEIIADAYREAADRASGVASAIERGAETVDTHPASGT